MEEQVIKSIEKGYGESSIFFSTDKMCGTEYRVDEIKQEGKQISNDMIISVYRGYKNNKLFFEMGITNDITVKFAE